MAYTFEQLKTAYTNANAGIAPDAATSLALDAYATQNKTGGISDATALANTYKLVNSTTAVAVETYQFFAGTAPSEAGLQFLGAALNGPTYKDFNQESRFINLAITLAIGTDAAPAFAAAYGGQGVTYQNTVATAYDKIIGNSVATAAGFDVSETVKYLSRAENISALTQFVKANVPGLTDAQVDLAVKAALIGEILNIAVETGLGAYATSTQKLIADLGDDGHLAAGPGAADLFASYPATPPSPPEAHTLTLTNGPDALTGGDGDDTFVASETTLSSADVLVGGKGVDTLRYASSGAGAVTESGFSAKTIEKVSVTSDATGGTTFDVTGVSDLTTIINDNSSQNVVFTGLGAPAALELSNVSGGDTTVTYKTAIVSGAADVQKITLNNDVTIGNGAIGTVTVNGVETFDVTSTGSVSKLAGLASDKLSKITVAGDTAVNLGNVNFQGATSGSATAAGNTLDASSFTGALTVKLANNSGTVDVAVKGGSGDDRVDFGNSYDKLDSFDGGAGVDTIALTNAVATNVVSTNSGTVTNVEVLAITDAGAGAVSLGNFAGVGQVTYEAGLANDVTVKDTGPAVTVVVGDDANNHALTLDLKADGATDVANIQLNAIGAADLVGAVTTADANSDFETVNLVVRDDASIDGVGKVTVANLVTAAAADQFATTLTIDSNVALTFAAATTTQASGADTKGLSVLDASASTGNLDLTKLTFQAVAGAQGNQGATIKLGSGDDKIITGNGADTVTLGEGKDTVSYNTVAQSSGASVDTITDFKSGTDKIDATGLLGLNTVEQFVGNYASFGAAQGALTGTGVSAVFESDTHTLWVDLNSDGTLDANDLQVILSGVSSLTAADLSLTSGVTFTANTNSFSTAIASNSSEGVLLTNTGDTIKATVAQLAGATINGLGGTDVLTISGTAATGEIADLTATNTLTSVEKVTLASSVEGVKFANTQLGAGKVTTVTGAAGANQSLTVNDGTNLSGVTLSNLPVLNLTDEVTLTAAQHNAFTTINAAGGADQVTLTTAGTIVANDAIETYSIVEGSTLTIGTTAAALARSVTETGAVGTVSTLVFGAGAYTGAYTGIDATDVLKVVNNTDLHSATVMTNGTVDFANAAATLTLNANQNGTMTFVNTTGAQTVNVSAADTFNAAAGIETYSLVGGSNVTVNAATTGLNVTSTNVGATTVNVDGLTVTGTYNLGHGADVIVATDGANIAGVNSGALTTAEALTLTGGITMTAAQYNGFTGTITAAGASSVTLTTSGTIAASAVIETYTLNGTGADQITISETANAALTDTIRDGLTVNLAGGGADVVVLENATVDNSANSSVTITGFGSDDKLQLSVGATSTSDGLFYNNYTGAAALGNLAAGSVVEIDAGTFTTGTLSNTAAVLAGIAGLPNAIVGAAGALVTLVVYDGAGHAGIYQMAETSGVGTAFDSIELVGIVNAADNSLVAANFG